MPGFVHGGATLLVLRERLFAFQPEDHAIRGAVEVVLFDRVLARAGGLKRGFVAEVPQIRAAHADHRSGDAFEIDRVRQRFVARVNL